jgi:hypothetical protein
MSDLIRAFTTLETIASSTILNISASIVTPLISVASHYLLIGYAIDHSLMSQRLFCRPFALKSDEFSVILARSDRAA